MESPVEMVSFVGHSSEKSSEFLSQHMNFKVIRNCQDDWRFA